MRELSIKVSLSDEEYSIFMKAVNYASHLITGESVREDGPIHIDGSIFKEVKPVEYMSFMGNLSGAVTMSIGAKALKGHGRKVDS